MDFFDTKYPSERAILTFDMSAGLINGATQLVPSPTIAVEVYLGTDPTPLGILNGSASLDATQTKILLPVQAGVLGCQYLITASCATNVSTTTLAKQAVLPVGGSP